MSQTSPESDGAIDVASMLSRAQEFVDRNTGADREDMARAIIMFFRSELMRRAGRSSEFAQTPDQPTMAFPRWWVQKCYDQLSGMGQFPSGPLGDWAFLFRAILHDALEKAALTNTSTDQNIVASDPSPENIEPSPEPLD